MLSRTLRVAALLVSIALAASLTPAHSAAEAPLRVTAEPTKSQARARAHTAGMGILGFLTGFLAHEAGHVTVNLMLGNVPEFEGFFVWGFVPFFAIAPRIDCEGDRCVKYNGQEFGAGPRGKFAIVSAGYNVQHVTDEIILTRAPGIAREHAPFRKGILLFNVFLSCMYSVGAWTGLQDPHGDLAGMGRASGFNEIGLSAALMLPAIFDTIRYFMPRSERWSAWLSRGSKAAFVGLTLTF